MEGRYGFSEGLPEGKWEGLGFPRDFPRAEPEGNPEENPDLPTFPRAIPRKTHTFPTLANEINILYMIGVWA